MSLENLALARTDDFPIRHEGKVHSGKVRSVYWLSPEDSYKLILGQGYDLDEKLDLPSGKFPLGIMIISDKISAFDCNWKGEDNLGGIPRKGAALNTISAHWFSRFRENGLAESHIVDIPHPLVWIVRRADTIKVEAIGRQYITGSMWRDYSKGAREFCGIKLPDELQEHQRLDELMITPTTKGILRGIPGVPEKDDVNITREQIAANYKAFGFRRVEDVDVYESLLRKAFPIIAEDSAAAGQIFVDTKFEFGYVQNNKGVWEIRYIDEVGTPDSSRFWPANKYNAAPRVVVEESKEGFRQFLLANPALDRDVLLKSDRMPERKKLAENYRVPVEQMMKVSDTYVRMAETLTGKPLPKIEDAREEIMQVISQYGLAA